MSSPPENAPSTELPFRLPESADRRAGPVSGTRPLAVWAALAIVYVIWGSTYLGIRIAVETFPPYLSASVRFVAAALVLGALIAVRRGPSELRVRPRQVGAAALVGVLLLTGGNGLVVGAEHAGLPSGVAALLIAVVLLRLVTGDRPGWPTLGGVVVGFAGLAGLVASRGGGGTVHVAPALVVVVGAASWSVGSFFSGRLPLPGNPFVGSMYQMAAGGLVLAAIGLATGETVHHVSTRSWLAVGYLTLAGSLVAYTSYVWLLRHAPISLVSTYAYVNPAVAVLFGALFVHERITVAVLVSGAVTLAGVALVVQSNRS